MRLWGWDHGEQSDELHLRHAHAQTLGISSDAEVLPTPAQQGEPRRSEGGSIRGPRPPPLDTSQQGLAAPEGGQLGALLAQLSSPGLLAQASATNQVWLRRPRRCAAPRSTY
jgi:hypothetical protein